MGWTVTKVSDVGVSHPVIARLVLQTMELLKFTTLSEKDRKEIGQLYFDELQPVLIECHRTRDEIEKETVACLAKAKPDNEDHRVIHMDQVMRLNQKAESFLYQAKNYLRNSLKIWSFFYGCDLKDASVYIVYRNKTKSELEKWAEGKFGADDKVTALIRSEQLWAGRLVQMRNAIEHPGGNSGTLHIQNVRHVAGQFVGPTWHLDDDAPTLMLTEMDAMLDGLLTLGEDILLAGIVPKMNEMFSIYEIPQAQRDPEQPVRLKADASPEFRKRIEESHSMWPPNRAAPNPE